MKMCVDLVFISSLHFSSLTSKNSCSIDSLYPRTGRHRHRYHRFPMVSGCFWVSLTRSASLTLEISRMPPVSCSRQQDVRDVAQERFKGEDGSTGSTLLQRRSIVKGLPRPTSAIQENLLDVPEGLDANSRKRKVERAEKEKCEKLS